MKLDCEWRILGLAGFKNSITVAEILETSLPIGQCRERPAHHRFGVVHDALHDPHQAVGAIAPCQSFKPRDRAMVGRHLGPEIASTLFRCPDVGKDDVLHFPDWRTSAIQPDRWEPEAFPKNLRFSSVAAGCSPADIRPVSPETGKSQQALIIGKCRRHDVDIGKMRATEIRVVMDEYVARLDVLPCLYYSLDRKRHGTKMHGQVGTLSHHVAAYIEDSARKVTGRLQDGGIGGFREDDSHFGGH